MFYGQEDWVWEARDKFVSSHFLLRKSRHRDSERSTGRDPMMNQERCCRSKVIAEIMIVFITSVFVVLTAQICDFIKVAVTLFILHDNMPASAMGKVVTFAGEVLFERKRPTSIKPEATLAGRIGLRIPGQFEELLYTEWEKTEIISHSNLTKQVLKSPNKSTKIADWSRIKHRKILKESITVLCHMKIQKTHAQWKKGNLERHARIVFDAKYA